MMQVACGYTIPITLFGIPPSPADHLKGMEIMGQAGFKLIELELCDVTLETTRRDLPAMQAIINKYGMRLVSITAVEEKMFSLDPALKRQALIDFDQLTDIIVQLGAPLVSICGYVPPEIHPQGEKIYVGGPPSAVSVDNDFSWSAFWANAVDMVKQCAAIAKRKGLTLVIETRAKDVFNNTDALMNLIRESGADNAGIVYDVAHVHAAKEYLTLSIRKVGKLIKLVHLADNDSTEAYHYAPGKGNIDFRAVIQSLKHVGYDGIIVVDICGVPNVVEEAVKARDYFQQIIDEVGG